MIQRGRDRPSLRYSSGKRALAAHDPLAALRLLKEAVDECPASSPRALSERLYWLAITLRRLGKDGLAVKALASAQRLAPRGRARSMYERVANGYGMPKAACREHDDYRAFCSIQLGRYLARVPERRFADQAEADAVLAVIADAWLRLARSRGEERPFASIGCDDKLQAFRAVRIDFPTLRERPVLASASVIQVNFRAGKAVEPGDRCPCGSGLPYRRCCGRVKAPYEGS